jgi:dynein heavy chain
VIRALIGVQVTRNDRQWKNWFDKDAPEEEVIPDGYNTTLDVFRRLLLVRSWCPDRTLPQAKKYIGDTLGSAFAEGVILDIEKMSKESNCRTPMIGLLSMGSDPTISIEQLAKKLHLGACMKTLPSLYTGHVTPPRYVHENPPFIINWPCNST